MFTDDLQLMIKMKVCDENGIQCSGKENFLGIPVEVKENDNFSE
jgi:hypothetical protein